MTRILLPVLIGICVVLLGSMLLPLAIPDWWRRIRALDAELEDLYEWER